MSKMRQFKMRFPSQVLIEGDFRCLIKNLEGKRILVIGSERSTALANWEALLPKAEVRIFSGSLPHSPIDVFEKALDIAIDFSPDTYIAIGSGSAIDLAKALSGEKAANIVAIPTSLGGGEMTNVYGIRTHSRTKEGKGGYRFIPSTVIYDPTLLLTIPFKEMVASAINSFAHCVEAYYSTRNHWFGKAAALSGAQKWLELFKAMPSQGEKIEIDFASELFEAASLGGYAINTCGLGLHHAVCHVVGGETGITHGIVNAVVLPKALEVNRNIAPLSILELEKKLAVKDLVEHTKKIIQALQLPSSLNEIGFECSNSEILVERLLDARQLKFNPGELSPIQAKRLIEGVYSGAI